MSSPFSPGEVGRGEGKSPFGPSRPGQQRPQPPHHPQTQPQQQQWHPPANQPAHTDQFARPGPSTSAPGRPSSGSSSAPSSTSAPTAKLIPSLVMGVISLLMSLYLFISAISATQSSYITLAGIAWALAGILGIGAMALYFTGDSQERASGFYVQIAWKQALYVVTLIVLGLAVILSAVHIGLWFGKA